MEIKSVLYKKTEMEKGDAYFALALFLCLAPASFGEATHYTSLQTYRLVDSRQTSPKGPQVTGYKIGLTVNFKTSNPVHSVQLRPAKGKAQNYKKEGPTRWTLWTKGIPGAAAYLKAYPGGVYTLQCQGGVLHGQSVAFRIPDENLVNPSIPYLEANSFRLLSRRKLKAGIDNPLAVLRTRRSGRPFVTTAQPPNHVDGCFAQIRDTSRKGTDGEFVWYHSFAFNSANAATFTLPAGTLQSDTVYHLSLQTDHTGPTETVSTPEGPIQNTSGGITFYELVFKTSK